MWLLSTDRAELRFFNSPTDVPHGYAILSHVWGINEQTFQETKDIAAQCAKDGENPRDKASEKIRRFCELAESHGYEWGWVDTCCIDKSSSAELSEAINSMFDYYARAEVCYAYLEDVERRGDEFWLSKWHTRGWTLQELLAPDVVVFLSSRWEVMGTKTNLADDIQKATGVPKEVLTLEMSLTDTSVAERMSWAANRRTTRLEDEAYCLMGIFGISMPTLYGEGRAAFRRLQEEIMKQSPDTSLFAWGRKLWMDYVRTLTADGDGYGGLLAAAPTAFEVRERGDKIRYVARPPTALADRIGHGMPTFTVTPYGILCTLPILRISQGKDLVVAPLFCTSHKNSTALSEDADMFVILTERSGAITPLGPLYDVAAYESSGTQHRLALLRQRLTSLSQYIQEIAPSWEDLYLSSGSPYAERPHILTNRALSAPIRIPGWLVQRLRNQSDDTTIGISQPATSVSLEWSGHPAAALEFSFQRQLSSLPVPLTLYYGLCSLTNPTQWVRFVVQSPGSVESTEHDCSKDHVNDWPDRSKVFVEVLHPGEGAGWGWAYTVDVKFCQSRQNPAVLVLSDLNIRVNVHGGMGLK